MSITEAAFKHVALSSDNGVHCHKEHRQHKVGSTPFVPFVLFVAISHCLYSMCYYLQTLKISGQFRRRFMGLLRIARTPLVTVSLNATVMQAVRTMDQESIGAVGITQDDVLVGIFSERDLMRRVVSKKLDPETTQVRDVMTSPVEAISRDFAADDALKLMLEKHIRHLPIVDRDGRLAGMISMRSLLHDKVQELTNQLDSLEAYFTADGFGGWNQNIGTKHHISSVY